MRMRWKLAAVFALMPAQISAGNSIPDRFIGKAKVINTKPAVIRVEAARIVDAKPMSACEQTVADACDL